MSDYTKLKELAEDTKGWDNLKSCWPEETEDGDLEVNWFVGAAIDDDDKYPVLEVNTAQYDALEDAGRLARFYAAANPAAVLALIASADQSEQDYKDVVGTIELRDIEISRLKAEVSGLKTGYEAYEQVVQGLKAEVEAFKAANGELSEINTARRNHLSNAKKAAGVGPMDDLVGAIEALRKDAERYQRVRDIACRVRASEGFRLAIQLPSPSGSSFNTAKAFDEAIDAAMGKGEQS